MPDHPPIDKERLEEDVDEDGTAPSYQDVETDYAPVEALFSRVFDDGAGYAAVVGDYQDRYIEIRVPREAIEAIRWERRGRVGVDFPPPLAKDATLLSDLRLNHESMSFNRIRDGENATIYSRAGAEIERLVAIAAGKVAWVLPEKVDRQGWWHWWNGDLDAAPVPVSVLHSGGDGSYFASAGQLGWTAPQKVLDMGGWWAWIETPPIPKVEG